MKDTCENLGTDLLMLVHGELKGWPRLRLEFHLLQCSECRARRKKMGSLTLSLSHVFQNPSLGYRTFGSGPRISWAAMALAALFVSGASWLTVSEVRGSAATAAVSVSGAVDGKSKSCDEEEHEASKAVALASKKKIVHPKRRHDNPDK